jgi:hypothetical protein
MSKKDSFPPKPTAVTPPNADARVSGGSSQSDAGEGTKSSAVLAKLTKRLTFDVPVDLHRRVKVRCAENGVEMADEMRRLLAERFPE